MAYLGREASPSFCSALGTSFEPENRPHAQHLTQSDTIRETRIYTTSRYVDEYHLGGVGAAAAPGRPWPAVEGAVPAPGRQRWRLFGPRRRPPPGPRLRGVGASAWPEGIERELLHASPAGSPHPSRVGGGRVPADPLCPAAGMVGRSMSRGGGGGVWAEGGWWDGLLWAAPHERRPGRRREGLPVPQTPATEGGGVEKSGAPKRAGGGQGGGGEDSPSWGTTVPAAVARPPDPLVPLEGDESGGG